MTITPEELLHMVNGVMTATAQAVSACNSQNQDKLDPAALGKMVDLLRGCKVTSYCRQCNLICGCEPDGRVWCGVGVACGCGVGVECI